MRVGAVTEVWRYPVKSLAGERLDGPVPFGPAGVEGDRGLAVVDIDSGKVLSAKRVPELLQARATYLGNGRVAIEGSGFEVTSDDADAALSRWLGRRVRLSTPTPGERAVFEMDDGSDIRTPPGSFFDSRSTLPRVTTASLGDWDAIRFRPNFVVETEAGESEDGWVERDLAIAGVPAHVRKRTSRCVMTGDAYRTILATRNGDLGVYVDARDDGKVAPGAIVELL
ncbi:MAG: uncharacterized protein QOF60_2456 [Actinomycetota bacterium]|nr:uncharacterized protein [Actinomycetota bacterium]